MKSTWNYRIGTRIFDYEKEVGDHFASFKNQRLFSIVSVYYEDDKVVSYGETNQLSDNESLKDLKNTFKYIKAAFKKPILDLDNFPNEWIDNDNK
jgi:hypothetical protein